MRIGTIVTTFATAFCLLAPRIMATPGAEDDPPCPPSPAIAKLPAIRINPGPNKVPSVPATALPGFNTADGDHALFNITSGTANTAVGWYSLFSNTDGSFNTAVGAGTLALNVGDQSTGEGIENTAIGTAALLFNSTGAENTAIGVTALENNSTGSNNTALGSAALQSNDESAGNTAVGHRTLSSNVGRDSNSNTAVGRVALTSHTTGSFNTAIGNQALQSDTSGARNTAVGSVALGGNLTGNDNTAIGRHAGEAITGNGNVCIGVDVSGEADVNNSTYIRNVNTTEQAPDNDIAFVTVRLSDNRIGHQPITERNTSSRLQDTVRELQSRVARQDAIIAEQRRGMEILTAQLKEQAAQMQKVTAHLEMREPATKVVVE